MPKKTFNETMKEKLDNCASIFDKFKTTANGKYLNSKKNNHFCLEQIAEQIKITFLMALQHVIAGPKLL